MIQHGTGGATFILNSLDTDRLNGYPVNAAQRPLHTLFCCKSVHKFKTLLSVATRSVVAYVLATQLAACSAKAQLVQVPNLPEPFFGNSNTIFPFSYGFGSLRYQQIYAANAFPNGGVIDKLMFRNDEGNGVLYGPLDIDLQIAFAYSARTVLTASPAFADNIGDDFTIVLDRVSTVSFDGSPSPYAFDFVLDVENNFNYDPLRGDLLVQILIRNQNAFTLFDASTSTQQGVTTRIWNSTEGINATTGAVGVSQVIGNLYGLVTQFEIVPEPSTLALLAIGCAAIGYRRRR